MMGWFPQMEETPTATAGTSGAQMIPETSCRLLDHASGHVGP